MELIRATGLDNGVGLLRGTTGLQECQIMLREVKPDVVVCDAGRRFKRGRGVEEMSRPTHGASTLVEVPTASDTRVLILEGVGDLLRTTEWNDEILPDLKRESYIVETVEISVARWGIPWR